MGESESTIHNRLVNNENTDVLKKYWETRVLNKQIPEVISYLFIYLKIIHMNDRLRTEIFLINNFNGFLDHKFVVSIFL